MATRETTSLKVFTREPGGSRTARRLRRAGNVPGIVYGGGEEPLSFSIESRELRLALAHAGAVMNMAVDGGSETPVVLKWLERHPVSGDTVHVDLLRVNLNVKIQSTVGLELVGADDAPGVKEGGILEHVVRELTIEALPNDIPDLIQHDVSAMQMNDTLTLEAITPPPGVELLDDLEAVVATLTPPRLQTESDDEIEAETEVVGEGATGDEAESAESGGDSGDSSSGAE